MESRKRIYMNRGLSHRDTLHEALGFEGKIISICFDLPIRSLSLGLLAILLLTACGDDPPPNPGDPIPIARAGMTALFGGDVSAIDDYFCEEITLDSQRIATEAAQGDARIELRDSQFTVYQKRSETNWLITLNGEYALWRYGVEEVHNTEQEGAVLIRMVVEDDLWQICDLAALEPATTSQ